MGSLRILVRDDIKMSRGKYAAQAVHAALLAAGVHHGDAVIVLGATKAEVEECRLQVSDAGATELEPGTLTAGVATSPWVLPVRTVSEDLPAFLAQIERVTGIELEK